MNDLTVVTDKELDLQVSLMEDRERAYDTPEGQKKVILKILEIFYGLSKCGYHLKDMDEKKLAKIWADKLREHIIRLGVAGVQEAVDRWVADDNNTYKVFPNVAWIYDKCSEIKGNPKAEKSRGEQLRREAEIEREHRAEVEQSKTDNPELWARAEARCAALGLEE